MFKSKKSYQSVSLVRIFNAQNNYFFQVIVVMLMNIGFKKTVLVFFQFPAFLLMPVFSLWTTGSVTSSFGSIFPFQCNLPITTNENNRSKRIYISFKNTCINLTITAIGSISYVVLFCDYTFKGTEFRFDISDSNNVPQTSLGISRSKSCSIFILCTYKSRSVYINLLVFE